MNDKMITLPVAVVRTLLRAGEIVRAEGTGWRVHFPDTLQVSGLNLTQTYGTQDDAINAVVYAFQQQWKQQAAA